MRLNHSGIRFAAVTALAMLLATVLFAAISHAFARWDGGMVAVVVTWLAMNAVVIALHRRRRAARSRNFLPINLGAFSYRSSTANSSLDGSGGTLV